MYLMILGRMITFRLLTTVARRDIPTITILVLHINRRESRALLVINNGSPINPWDISALRLLEIDENLVPTLAASGSNHFCADSWWLLPSFALRGWKKGVMNDLRPINFHSIPERKKYM